MFLAMSRRCTRVVIGLSLIGSATPVAAQRAPAVQANWALAEKFSAAALRPITYSSSVNARFINKTDSAWYNWRDRNGTRFMLVIPKTKTKQLMFDHAKFAADLSALHRK